MVSNILFWVLRFIVAVVSLKIAMSTLFMFAMSFDGPGLPLHILVCRLVLGSFTVFFFAAAIAVFIVASHTHVIYFLLADVAALVVALVVTKGDIGVVSDTLTFPLMRPAMRILGIEKLPPPPPPEKIDEPGYLLVPEQLYGNVSK